MLPHNNFERNSQRRTASYRHPWHHRRLRSYSIFDLTPWDESYMKEMEEQKLHMLHAPNQSVAYTEPIANLVNEFS